MTPDTAQAIALNSMAFILAEDTLRDRFMAMSGVDAGDIRTRIQDPAFLASVMEFLVGFEPDLMACAESLDEKPETLVGAWRALGGGEGHEW